MKRIITLLILFALTGCTVTTTQTPPLVNLHKNLIAVDAYYTDGGYEKEVEAIARQADRYLQQTLKSGRYDKPALVFDIDDTLLNNAAFYKSMNYRFRSTNWQQWVNAANIPAIRPMLELYDAYKGELDIFIITGRNVFQRAQTLRNLEKAGYSDWKAVFFKEAWDRDLNAEEYKLKIINQLISTEGYQVIGNFGDQASDFKARIQGRSFKLPNYLYVTK